MKENVQKFYREIPQEYSKTIEKLSSVILNSDDRITEDIKWKKLTFGLNEDFHHWLCQIYFTKKSVNLCFHFGGLLEDNHKVLIAGESKFLRKIEYKKQEDIDDEVVRDYVLQAISKLDYFRDNWKKL